MTSPRRSRARRLLLLLPSTLPRDPKQCARRLPPLRGGRPTRPSRSSLDPPAERERESGKEGGNIQRRTIPDHGVETAILDEISLRISIIVELPFPEELTANGLTHQNPELRSGPYEPKTLHPDGKFAQRILDFCGLYVEIPARMGWFEHKHGLHGLERRVGLGSHFSPARLPLEAAVINSTVDGIAFPA